LRDMYVYVNYVCVIIILTSIITKDQAICRNDIFTKKNTQS